MEKVAQYWYQRFEDADLALVKRLSATQSLNRLVTELLVQRGCVAPYDFDAFLSPSLKSLPDPSLLPGIEDAVDLIVSSVIAKKSIEIHGDYDVDGVTGTSLLVELFRSIGVQVTYFIPTRSGSGYGLSVDEIVNAAKRGVNVIISVDCGISSFEEAIVAKSVGIDLVITDHHQPTRMMSDESHYSLPDASAIVNPLLYPEQKNFHVLAGVGVAFFLAIAIRKKLRDIGYFNECPEPDLRSLLDLVALGTIADVVPLTGVNRVLVSAGLKVIENRRRKSLAALLENIGIEEVSTGLVAFQVAPRLNAVGRLENAQRCVDFLLETDSDLFDEYLDLLNTCNLQRREIEKDILKDALGMVAGAELKNIVVLAKDSWHQGVTGIVASRIVEHVHRPVLLIAFDGEVGKGSGRSVTGVDLYSLLQAASKNLDKFGGHKAAAGLTVARDKYDQFVQDLHLLAEQNIVSESLIPRIGYDLQVSANALSKQLASDLECFSPFGMKNPEPVFYLKGVLMKNVRILKEHHLAFMIEDSDGSGSSISCIGFGMSDSASFENNYIDVLGSLRFNRWRGRDELQLVAKAVRLR